MDKFKNNKINSQLNNKINKQSNNKIMCFICCKYGHYSWNCREKYDIDNEIINF